MNKAQNANMLPHPLTGMDEAFDRALRMAKNFMADGLTKEQGAMGAAKRMCENGLIPCKDINALERKVLAALK